MPILIHKINVHFYFVKEFRLFHGKNLTYWKIATSAICTYMEKMHTTLTFLYAFWDKTTVPFFGLTYLKVANLHKISAN